MQRNIDLDTLRAIAAAHDPNSTDQQEVLIYTLATGLAALTEAVLMTVQTPPPPGFNRAP